MANLITIRNKKTGGVMDVTPERFAEIKTTSRNWVKVGEVKQEPTKRGWTDKAMEDQQEEEPEKKGKAKQPESNAKPVDVPTDNKEDDQDQE